MPLRIVIEIPDSFADYCLAVGDRPRDVIADLIAQLMDEAAGPADFVMSPSMDVGAEHA